MKTTDRKPHRTHPLASTLTLLLSCSIAACGPKETPKAAKALGETAAERVTSISKLIGKSNPLPTPLLDAQFVEDQTGDGRLGPSDFADFYTLTVAPGDLSAWRHALPPMQDSQPTPAYVSPKQPTNWWLKKDDFKDLEFFDPKSLTGRVNGWIAIAPDGRIFIYSHTM